MMIGANLDHKSEHIREVSAWFGLAMFKAQCLERQIALMLATKYGPSPTRISKLKPRWNLHLWDDED